MGNSVMILDLTSAGARQAPSDANPPAGSDDSNAYRYFSSLLGPLRSVIEATKAEKFLTSMYYRQVDGSPPAQTDQTEIPIYVVSKLSVYAASAELLGIAFAPGGVTTKDRALAALIPSAELSMELGSAY
jgi:hypothetical protein